MNTKKKKQGKCGSERMKQEKERKKEKENETK